MNKPAVYPADWMFRPELQLKLDEFGRRFLAEGGSANLAPLYPDEMPLFQKVETIAKRIYHADAVIADKSIRDQLKAWEAAGYGHLPVCMAKTQYSFTTDPNLRGAPTGHSVPDSSTTHTRTSSPWWTCTGIRVAAPSRMTTVGGRS